MWFSTPFALLVPLCWTLTEAKPSEDQLSFELRHVHAVSSSTDRVVFADVAPSFHAFNPTEYTAKTRRVKKRRSRNFQNIHDARLLSIQQAQTMDMPWDDDEILGPNIESRETLLTLAKMTNDAYVVDNNSTEWYDLGSDWTDAYPFGWEPDADGFRGHVFATADNSTIVVSVKGTSAGIFGGGGPTAAKDKKNDNLLFSCCCARVDWTWTTVCNCYAGSSKCNQECLEDAIIKDSLYYPIGTNLYNNLTYMYPTSNIWIVGHSLGGALASLLGVTFGVPVIAFESPGEKLAASRLHLPSSPSAQELITHVYHTADPIAMGTCNGLLSACFLGGYALETRCHLGKSIVFDTVSNLSWSVSISHHGIVKVIEEILSKPWPPSEALGREVPEPKPDDEDCVECYSWSFGDFPPK